jgi:hypothetical protein
MAGKKSDSDFDSQTGSDAFDSEWGGEDWESAFQAEDYMFTPEEGNIDDYFQDGTEATSSPYDFNNSTESTDGSDFDSPGNSTAGIESVAPVEGAPQELEEISSSISFPLMLTSLVKHYQNLPLVQKILISLSPLVLILLIFIPYLSSSDPKTAVEKSPGSQTEQAASADTGAEPVKMGSNKTEQSEPEPEPEPEVKIKKIDEIIEKKWRLSPFYIPASRDQKNNKSVFVSVELTLLIVQKRSENLPIDKKSIARDAVYGFYAKRKSPELKKFLLSRQKMGKLLLESIKKQWPETPVKRVVFNRFQII